MPASPTTRLAENFEDIRPSCFLACLSAYCLSTALPTAARAPTAAAPAPVAIKAIFGTFSPIASMTYVPSLLRESISSNFSTRAGFIAASRKLALTPSSPHSAMKSMPVISPMAFTEAYSMACILSVPRLTDAVNALSPVRYAGRLYKLFLVIEVSARAAFIRLKSANAAGSSRSLPIPASRISATRSALNWSSPLKRVGLAAPRSINSLLMRWPVAGST